MEKKFHFEKEVLLASGVNGKGELTIYKNRLHLILQQLLSEISPISNPYIKARDLFSGLWKWKPFRYERHGQFRLSEVIDVQLRNNERPAGNCLGLTLLYNCLLRRMGANADALYLGNALEIGPHVLTLLQTEASTINIKNISPDGFDYKGHLDHPSGTRLGDREVVANICPSNGNELFSMSKFATVSENYEKASTQDPW